MTLAQTELLQAKELGYNTLGQLDYFSIDIADRTQSSIALYMKDVLKKSVERNLYVYVPLHTSHRAHRYLRTTARKDDSAPLPPRQRIFLVYDPPRIVASDEKQQQKKKKSRIIPSMIAAATAVSTHDTAAVPIETTIPPVKPETLEERQINVKKQLKRGERAMLVFRNSCDATCEIIMLPKHMFSELMASAYAASFVRNSRLPPTPSMQSTTMLSLFVNQPAVHFARQLMFLQTPYIVTDFVLNVPTLRMLKERAKTATWLPAPLDVTRREEALVRYAIHSGSNSKNSSLGATPAGWQQQNNETDATAVPSISTTISMDGSAECSDDDDDDDDSDNKNGASTSASTTATPSSQQQQDERTLDDQKLIDSLNAIENDKHRTGLQQHPFVDQLHDSAWLATRLCWFVAAFKQIFYREADASLGRKWSYVDLFYLLNQMQYVAERLQNTTTSSTQYQQQPQPRLLGNEQQFAEDPDAACMRVPSFVYQSVHDLVRKLYGKAFVNDAKNKDIVVRRVQHSLVEAMFFSEGIFAHVPTVVRDLQFAELLNRYQVRGTSRQRANKALMMPALSVPRSDIAHCMKTFVEDNALRFEEERIETIAAQSKRSSAFDLLLVLNLDTYRETTPLSIVSSVREFVPWARNGFDFLLLFTPLSYVDINDHDQHVTRQTTSPPNNTRTQEEQRAARAAASAADSTEKQQNGTADDDSKKHQRGLTETTLARRKVLLGMQYNVWRSLRGGIANTVLMQRARSINEYRLCAASNSFMRLFSPLVAETLVLNKRHSLETVCGALNSFNALCGGSNCEWTAGSRRATLYANKVAELLTRFCDQMIRGDAQRLFETLLKPISERYASLRMREINSQEEAYNDSFFSIVQLLLNGNQLPIACVDSVNEKSLLNLLLFSDFWRTYLRSCMDWRDEKNKTTGCERRQPTATPTTWRPRHNDNGSTQQQQQSSSVVVGCHCGGATAEECDATLKQGKRCCCICRLRDTTVDDAVVADDDEEPTFEDLCGWCRARLPLRGAHRVALGSAAALKKAPTASKVTLTLIDELDERRPERATFTELLEILLDQVDAGRAKFADVLTVLSSLRFELRGIPSRVAMPRSRQPLRFHSADLSKPIVQLSKSLQAYAAHLAQNNSDSRPLTEQTGARPQLHKLLKDRHLRTTLENTDALLFASEQMLTAPTGAPQQELLDDDQATLDTLTSSTTNVARSYFSLTLVTTALEILSLVPHQPIVAMYDIFSANRDSIAVADDPKADLKWTMIVALFDLLVPFRTADEVLRYYRRSCANSFSFPLCQPVFAEATMYENRSMRTLASNSRLPIEETLENMLFDRHIDRPATQAVQGILEFLFINSANIDATARDTILSNDVLTSLLATPATATTTTTKTQNTATASPSFTPTTAKPASARNNDDDDDDDRNYTGKKIAGETKAQRLEREQYEEACRRAFAPTTDDDCGDDDDNSDTRNCYNNDPFASGAFNFTEYAGYSDDNNDDANSSTQQSNRKRKLK